LYRVYQLIAHTFPGWSLTEIKDMPVREREYWFEVQKFRREYEQWQQMTKPQSRAW
jgi:hypothetical protein